jgi:hypothetical protein
MLATQISFLWDFCSFAKTAERLTCRTKTLLCSLPYILALLWEALRRAQLSVPCFLTYYNFPFENQ